MFILIFPVLPATGFDRLATAFDQVAESFRADPETTK